MYSWVTFGLPYDEQNSSGDAHYLQSYPLSLIWDILIDPRIAYYPVEVQFQVPVAQDDDLQPEEFQRLLIEFFDKHPSMNNEEVTRWKKEAYTGSTSALFALLLTLLPNVRRIIIHGSGHKSHVLRRIMDKILKSYCNLTSDPPSRMALNKLSEVSFMQPPGIDPTTQSRALLPLWEQFAILPSMRSLQGRFLCRELCARPTRGARLPQKDGSVDHSLLCKRSLREICLDNSLINTTVLNTMLAGAIALQRFTYSRAEYIWKGGCRDLFDPVAMVEILQSTTKTTLVHLDLSWNNFSNFYKPHFIGSLLRAFEVLKRIRVQVPVFAKSLHNKSEPCEPEPLVDVLPTSIERLDLVGAVKAEEAISLLAGLPERKEERVPNLQSITFPWPHRETSTLITRRVACEESGITYTIRGMWDSD